MPRFVKLLLLLVTLSFTMGMEPINDSSTKSIYVVMLARNKEHILNYFFNAFESLSYPKDKMSLFIRSDHNSDQTNEVIRTWLAGVERQYQAVNVELEDGPAEYDEEVDEGEYWGSERNLKLVLLKEKGLNEARKKGSDYVLFLDMDAFLVNPDVLQKLIKEDKTIVAPMLTSVDTYSTFWGAMTDTFWYKRSNDYVDILTYEKQECFAVPLVSGCVLVNLKDEATKKLSFYQYRLPGFDTHAVPAVDIIIFALSAQRNQLDLHVTNRDKYGHILLSGDDNRKTAAAYDLDQIRTLEIANYPKHVNTFDRIFCLTSLPNPVARNRREAALQKLGLTPTFVEGVSSSDLNVTFVKSLNITPLPEYTRTHALTYDQVGHFLTHYFIWQKVVENNFEQVIVLEDGASLAPNFHRAVHRAVGDLKRFHLDWDFVYLGGSRLRAQDEATIPGTLGVVRPGYSLNAPGYLLSSKGAFKLLNAKPLDKLVPLHHFLAIMFDKHPQPSWQAPFPHRDLKAFALSPAVVSPPPPSPPTREEEESSTPGPRRATSDLFETDLGRLETQLKQDIRPLKTEL